MSRPIILDVRAKTDEAERGLGQVSDALDETARAAEDAHDSMTRDASRAYDRMSDEARRHERDATRAADDTARAAEDAHDSMTRDASRAYDRMSDEAEKAHRQIANDAEFAYDRVGDEAEGAKGRVGSVANEVGDLMRGGFEDGATGAVEALAGIAPEVGGNSPVGLAISAAIGGVIGALAQQWREHAEEQKQQIADMYDAMLESGQRYLTEEQMQDALNELYQDDGKMAELSDRAEHLGLSIETVAAAYVTAGDAREKVTERALSGIEAEQAKLVEYREAMEGTSRAELEAYGRQIQAGEEQILQYQAVLDLIAQQEENLESAGEKADSFRLALSRAMADHRKEYENTGDALSQYGELMNTYAAEWSNMPVRINVEALTKDAEEQIERLTRRRRVVIEGVYRDGMAVI